MVTADVVVVGGTVEEVEVGKGVVVMFTNVVVVGLSVVVGDDVVDKCVVVVVSNGGTPVVDGDRVVVEQC